MKKRLSKLALLAVAAAFVLVGFPACGDDDEGGEPPAEASATFAGVEIPEGGLALTAGTPQDVTATLTVANSAFGDAVKALETGTDISEYITLSAGEKVSISNVKIAETANDTTMKITFTVAAEDGAESGTITATLKAAALTADKDVAATGTISYTVTAADPNAPKATFTGDNVPVDGVALTTGEEKTGNATITVENTTFSDALKALNEGDEIPDDYLALNAGGKVTVSNVKVATKATDTAIEITFTVTAGNEAGADAIKATLKADALKDYNKQVFASGSIAFTVKEKETVAGTDYEWNFQAAKLVTLLSYRTNDGGSISATEVAKVTLEAAGTYESTPAGLTLNLPEDGTFNKVAPNGSVSSSYKIEASKGSIEPDGTTVLTVDVTGPFTAVMLCGANSSTDKTDRYAFIKINDKEVCAPLKEENKLPAAGQALSYTYEGTDTVTVAFGGTNVVRIHDIKITTAKIDATGKTAGEVMSKATFVPMTDNSTMNDEATLGLVGTEAESSDTSVATVSITDDGKIAISAVAAGNTIITVRNAEKNEATIEVSVSGTGAISIGKIEKYDSKTYISVSDDGVATLLEDAYVYTLVFDNIEGATFKDAAWITGSAKSNGSTQWSSQGAVDVNETYGSPNALNSGSTNRTLTIKINGVKVFKLYGANSTANREVTVAVDNGDAISYKHDGNSSSKPYDFVSIDLDGNAHTLVLTGGSATIKLTAIELLKEVPTSAGDSAE